MIRLIAKNLRYFLVALLAAASSFCHKPSQSDSNWEKCYLPGGGKGDCLTLRIPFFHDNTSSKTFDSKIIKVEASQNSFNKSPLLLIAGGPGQSAIETFAPIISRFSGMAKNRDIYLIDVRGTENASPLTCPDSEDHILETKRMPTPDEYMAILLKCRQGFQIPLESILTSNIVRDFEFIRQKLGIEKWIPYGFSYGTRVIIEYLRLFPQSLERIILEGVAGPDLNLALRGQDSFAEILNRLIENCQQSKTCLSNIGNLKQHLQTIYEDFKTPQTIDLIVKGNLTKVIVQRNDLFNLISQSLYGDSTRNILHKQLQDMAIHKRYNEFFNANYSSSPSIAEGMYFSIFCAEEMSQLSDVERSQDITSGYFVFPLTSFNQICKQWFENPPAKNEGKRVHSPLEAAKISGIPTLMFSGMYDPATPISSAKLLAEKLSPVNHVIFPDYSHTVFHYPCSQKLVKKFLNLDSGQELDKNITTAAKLDTECIDSSYSFKTMINYSSW